MECAGYGEFRPLLLLRMFKTPQKMFKKGIAGCREKNNDKIKL